MKKLFIFFISLVIATIVVQAIVIAVIAVLKISFISNLPKIVSILIFIIGFSSGIFCGFLSFKKLFRYLKEESSDSLELK